MSTSSIKSQENTSSVNIDETEYTIFDSGFKTENTTLVILGLVVYSLLLLYIIYRWFRSYGYYKNDDFANVDKALEIMTMSLIIISICGLSIGGVFFGFFKKYLGKNKTKKSNNFGYCFLGYGIISYLIFLTTLILFFYMLYKYQKLLKELVNN